MQYTLQTIHTILLSTPARWAVLSKTLPGELIRRQPVRGEWSALECLGHLVDTERWVFPPRVEAFLAGGDFVDFDPEKQGTLIDERTDAVGLAEQFAEMRTASLAALEKLSSADLEKQAHHSQLGPVTLSEMLHEWAGHDLMHTVQAERALMQPFITGSGPWVVYFKDHLAIKSG